MQGQVGGKLQKCYLHPTPIFFGETSQFLASVEVEKEATHLYMPNLRNTSLTIQGCAGRWVYALPLAGERLLQQ